MAESKLMQMEWFLFQLWQQHPVTKSEIKNVMVPDTLFFKYTRLT